MNKVLLFFLVCFLATNAFAQTSEGTAVKVWTLKECVDYALANNLDVQRSQYNVESAEINHLQSKMAMFPSLNGSISTGYNWGRSINPVTNEFTTQEIRSLSPNANSSVTLFNGLRIQNTIRQNARDHEASEQDLLKTKNDVALNVINLYINVIFNKELLENAKSQLSSSQEQLERTKKQVAAGALPLSNELNLDAQVATNELNVINNENSLNFSLLRLKQALQLPASTAMDVEVPDVSVEDLVIDQSSQQIFEIAKQTMPEIRSAELKVRSSYYAAKAARGNLYPRLSLSGSINSNYSSANDIARLIPDGGSEIQVVQIGYWDSNGTPMPVYRNNVIPTGSMSDGYGYRDQLSDNIFRSVGLTLTIPIFNGLQARAGVRRAVIAERVAEISAKQVHQTLRQNVETAFTDAVAASKSYNSSLRQVQAREEAYRITKQRFDIGAANYVEYRVAENDLFQGRSDLARAKYNFIFRKKLLDFYQGKPLGF
ncbi:TolC family protein [Fulvivirgaceae bacterium PWU4]|uniref:TolC family protein n=1 Tax=Chryseosolibacter histidini TaxID=2782349 RepID=A0AAP2GPB9_9BACT|nr:TolC family protein [Chryseosolibacter histidini]MBT1697780.1 TolC family protein [Chryseosolibacter histidini]